MALRQVDARLYPRPWPGLDGIMDLIEARLYHLQELQRLRGHARNHPTQKLYGSYERRHLEYLDAHHLDPPLEMLNPYLVAACQLWIRDVHGPGSRDGRVAEQTYVKVMRIWSRFLFRRRIIATDVLRDIDMPRLPKIRRRPFTQDEALRLRDAILQGREAVRDRAIAMVLADTGCRVGELCGLELPDVVQDDGQLRGTILLRHTKGGTPRDVLMPGGRGQEALRHWLRVRRAGSAGKALFVTSRGVAMLPPYVRRLHADWGKLAGVSPCHPHMWRHTAATEALAAGVPENSIRDRFGHLSPEVLHDYLHQSDSTRFSAAERASLSEKWGL